MQPYMVVRTAGIKAKSNALIGTKLFSSCFPAAAFSAPWSSFDNLQCQMFFSSAGWDLFLPPQD